MPFDDSSSVGCICLPPTTESSWFSVMIPFHWKLFALATGRRRRYAYLAANSERAREAGGAAWHGLQHWLLPLSLARIFNRWRSPAALLSSSFSFLAAADVRNMCILQMENFHCSPALPRRRRQTAARLHSVRSPFFLRDFTAANSAAN